MILIDVYNAPASMKAVVVEQALLAALPERGKRDPRHAFVAVHREGVQTNHANRCTCRITMHEDECGMEITDPYDFKKQFCTRLLMACKLPDLGMTIILQAGKFTALLH